MASLGERVVTFVNEADFVIHAGDADTLEFISELKKNSKELYLVGGNCDIGIGLPLKSVFEIEGVKIALCHGAGGDRGDIPQRLYYLFYDDEPDIIIFGHTHAPVIYETEGVTFINPGSPLRNRTLPYGTFCDLIINNGSFQAKILRTDTI